jgi:hypothetical protein
VLGMYPNRTIIYFAPVESEAKSTPTRRPSE